MTGDNPRAFGALLRRHRQRAGLTQEALAESAGLSVRGISDLERGVNRAPYVATILRLGDALGLADEERAELEAAVSRRRGPATERPIARLPEQFTSLIGREKEVAAAVHLLRWEGRRLLTLTGPGGVGKTRLAIEIAATVATDFEGGAVFVPLEAVVALDGVRRAIAAAIHQRDKAGQALHESLVEYLRDREILLVLDGFEHLMDAAPLPGQLLVACPRLKIVITSRSPLHLSGEQELDVKSLPVPDPRESTDLAHLRRCPSVALFVQRAQKVKPAFDITTEGADSLAEICRQLDGLPLAIELAAARIKVLSPQALLLALERRLDVLIGGPLDMQPRQQTMRHTIAWSYDLLNEEARMLFRCLSVFNAAFSAEAAAAVSLQVGGSSFEADDGIGLLVDSSLLVVDASDAGEPRFSMLETIREYGRERLDEHRDREGVLERLADYCVRMAETAEGELHGVDQARWMARLEREHSTLLLVLRWARESAQVLTGLRIAATLWRFWYSHGYLSEGRRQLEGLLAACGHSDSMPLPLFAKAFRGTAVLAAVQGDYVRAQSLTHEGLRLYRRLGDLAGEAAMLVILGSIGHYTGDYPTARARYEEALELFAREGDEPSIALTLNNLATIEKDEGRTAASITLYEESLAIKRRLGDSRGIAIVLNNLGTLALTQGQYDRAVVFGEEALRLLRDRGDKDVTAAIDTVARAALHQGNVRRAAALYDEGLAVSHAAGNRELLAFCLEGAGRVAAAEGEMERAATLYGAGESLRAIVGAPLAPSESPEHSACLDVARSALGLDVFTSAWEHGLAMDLEEAVAFAGRR